MIGKKPPMTAFQLNTKFAESRTSSETLMSVKSALVIATNNNEERHAEIIMIVTVRALDRRPATQSSVGAKTRERLIEGIGISNS